MTSGHSVSQSSATQQGISVLGWECVCMNFFKWIHLFGSLSFFCTSFFLADTSIGYGTKDFKTRVHMHHVCEWTGKTSFPFLSLPAASHRSHDGLSIVLNVLLYLYGRCRPMHAFARLHQPSAMNEHGQGKRKQKTHFEFIQKCRN